MYTKILPGSILFLLALTSCQQNSPSTALNGAGKPALPASSPTVSVSSNSAPEVKARYYNGTGKVTKINMEIGSVELDHEEIKDLMPKMIMEFYVADKSQLKDLKIGDRVDFVLEDKGGAERISSIKKAETQKGEKR
ncbi:MAG TPA: copper-binding protein [Pyrinomonadaceae bacterium]|jgi:Cu/Ag efflux protein CusF